MHALIAIAGTAAASLFLVVGGVSYSEAPAAAGKALFTAASGVAGAFSSVEASVDWPNGESFARTLVLDHESPGDAVLDIGAENGAVYVVRDPAFERMTVEATVRSRSKVRTDAAVVEIARDSRENMVRVRAVWPGNKTQSGDACSFIVRVPDAGGVRIGSDNGAITVRGTRGSAELSSDNGSIVLLEHEGPVRVSTDNGSVLVYGATRVDASSDNGRIRLKGVGTPVTASTDNGAVEITLRDDAEGPVEVKTDNGRVELMVGPTFGGTLTARTSHGGVRVDESVMARGVTVERTGRDGDDNRAVVRFGPGKSSSIVTDNGKVVVGLAEADSTMTTMQDRVEEMMLERMPETAGASSSDL